MFSWFMVPKYAFQMQSVLLQRGRIRSRGGGFAEAQLLNAIAAKGYSSLEKDVLGIVLTSLTSAKVCLVDGLGRPMNIGKEITAKVVW
jgi:hypothetical protein